MLSAMSTFDLSTFESAAGTRGFDEVAVRAWDGSAEVATHTHPFSVHALVVKGEMWLTCGGATRHLIPGDTFDLDHAVEHAERYGPEGATYWAARRNAPAA